MKIVTIIGARPQFIKAAALSREIRKHPDIEEVILHTGQHFDPDMSDVFFRELSVPQPRYNLGINNLRHGAMTGHMLIGIEKVLIKELPDFALVYGDTNSTLAGALAASKLNIEIIHIEAGLRSNNNSMPEELNRIITDRISSLLFCPTVKALRNLVNEGFRNFRSKMFQVGDVMYDNALYYSGLASKIPLTTINAKPPGKRSILCTFHRAENTDDLVRLETIIRALNDLSTGYNVIVPIHPRTQQIITNHGFRTDFEIKKPQSYLEMINLIINSDLIVTDSGGLQKEAFFFKKFCITLRDETEWTELVDNGVNALTGADYNKILSSVDKYLSVTYPEVENLYGDGHAAEKICQIIKGHTVDRNHD